MRKHDGSGMPVGKLERVQDFLPPPHELGGVEPTVKITISLNQSSVDFFKKVAERSHTKYQKMIREILDHYVSHYRAA